uniref:RNA-dependent RNA polymerase n=1 Tax=Tetranychus urticae TaxID=32264 RepID=T1JWM7_TETUR
MPTQMLSPVSFELEIVHSKKRLLHIVNVLLYIKNIFIDSKVTSAEITDNRGNKHRYSEGSFSSTWCDKPRDSPSKSVQWKGTVDLKTNQLGDLISNISPRRGKIDDSYGYFWRFDENSYNFRQVIGTKSSNSKLPSNIANFAFGNIVNGDCFVSHFSTQSSPKIADLNVELVSHKNELNLMFTVIDETGTKKKVKFRYDCDSIKSAIIHHVRPFGFSLYAALSNAPKMFVADGQSCFINGRNQINWKRKSSCGPISRDLIGKCNVLRLTWVYHDTSYMPALYLWRRHLKFDLSFGSIINCSNFLVDESIDMEFPDKIGYLLACLKSWSYNYQDDLHINYEGEAIINEFIKKQISAGKSDQVQRALHHLHESIVNCKVINVFEHFKDLLNKVELEWTNIKDLEKDTEHIKYVKTGVFTPSRTVFMPPVMTRTSKFLDSAEIDCVLRVIYRDENSGPLSSTFNNFGFNQQKGKRYDEENVDCVTSMLKHRLLKNGLCVAGRTYQYFGASPSQLKDGGMMLYSKDSQNRTAASIRSSLGIVKEKSVPKYMSRIGLSLSQVMAFVDLPGYTKIYLTSDIYGGSHPHTNKPYNFTDGCGSISLEAARYIYDDLIRQKVLERKGDDCYIPSAFQIRFMGSKGMLVVDPDLIGMTIVIRESMQKMFTERDRLGIVKVSEPRRAYLNKPFIMVLNQIGLCHDFFINLTTTTLRDLNSSFYDEQVALMTMKLYTHLNRVVSIDAFANCNFSFTNDSFFQAILHLAVKQAFDSLKTKQRIPLPWFEARTMLGVCDTTAKSPKVLANFEKGICQPSKLPVSMDGLGTGALKEGQVFCWPSDFPEPLRGEVIVTKFPTSDLGGVRRLVAVDCKQLHAIRDCIVFPVDGKRPHQDEMAGSDLDGDEYCVIWMEDILGIQERIPMTYPDNPKAKTQDEISDERMIEHHINCVKSDQVGQISNAQLALADSKGYDSDLCKSLGYKYNGALDAPKNGFDSRYLLRRGDRPLETPDYMDKWSIKPTYYSTSACGEIYRLVNLHQLSSIFLNVPAVFEPSSDIDERLLHPRMLKFITFAAESLLVYESRINHLLTRYGLKSEVELFTGILDGSSPSLLNESSRIKDKEDAMVAVLNSLLINKMDELFDSKLINASEDDKMAAASAIYYVSKQKVKETTTSYIGLPFIGNCAFYLRKYMKYKATTKKREKTPTTKAVVTHNQSTIEHPLMASAICKIKDKVINIIETFLTYGKGPKHTTLAISSRIDKVMSRDDPCAVVSLPVNILIAKLIQETKLVWTNLTGQKNNELNLNQFINTTIPTLIRSLLVDGTSLYKNEKTTSDYINQSFQVNYCKRGTHDLLWTLLEKTLAADTQIEILSDSMEKNSIPVVIHGSPTSIWVASMIIGIHNRLTSIHFKNYAT